MPKPITPVGRRKMELTPDDKAKSWKQNVADDTYWNTDFASNILSEMSQQTSGKLSPEDIFSEIYSGGSFDFDASADRTITNYLYQNITGSSLESMNCSFLQDLLKICPSNSLLLRRVNEEIIYRKLHDLWAD